MVSQLAASIIGTPTRLVYRCHRKNLFRCLFSGSVALVWCDVVARSFAGRERMSIQKSVIEYGAELATRPRA